jgi:hypothetical protein
MAPPTREAHPPCVTSCTSPKTAVALCAAHCPAGTLDWRHCLDAGADPDAGADAG